MSSYAYIYLINNDKATALYTASRSSLFYKLLDDAGAPYEKVSPLSLSRVEQILDHIEADQVINTEQIKESEDMIEVIARMPDDIDVRLEKIDQYKAFISEYKEDMNDLTYWKTVFQFIKSMIEDIASNIEYDHVDDQIWFGMGIDSGTKPTKEDFVFPAVILPATSENNDTSEEESES